MADYDFVTVLSAELLAARNLAGARAREAVGEGLAGLATRWVLEETTARG